jgi:hypothetical protein
MRRRLSIRDVRVLASDADKEQLSCPICMEVVDQPRACRDGHLFCKSCIEEWLQRNRGCPANRANMELRDLVVPPLIRELTGRLLVACVNEGREGCVWRGSFDDLEGHVKVCPFRKLACRWCANIDTVARTVAHELRCERRPVRCPHCVLEVQAALLAAHVNGPCLASPSGDVLCVCRAVVKRRDEEAHVRQDVARHIRAQRDRMLELQRRVKELEKQGAEERRRGDEMRRTLTFVRTLCLSWRVRLGPDPTNTEAFFFAGLSMFVSCSPWNDRFYSAALCSSVTAGPVVMASIVVTDGLVQPIRVVLRSDGKTLIGGQWSCDLLRLFFVLPLLQPDGTREVYVALSF